MKKSSNLGNHSHTIPLSEWQSIEILDQFPEMAEINRRQEKIFEKFHGFCVDLGQKFFSINKSNLPTKKREREGLSSFVTLYAVDLRIKLLSLHHVASLVEVLKKNYRLKEDDIAKLNAFIKKIPTYKLYEEKIPFTERSKASVYLAEFKQEFKNHFKECCPELNSIYIEAFLKKMFPPNEMNVILTNQLNGLTQIVETLDVAKCQTIIKYCQEIKTLDDPLTWFLELLIFHQNMDSSILSLLDSTRFKSSTYFDILNPFTALNDKQDESVRVNELVEATKQLAANMSNVTDIKASADNVYKKFEELTEEERKQFSRNMLGNIESLFGSKTLNKNNASREKAKPKPKAKPTISSDTGKATKPLKPKKRKFHKRKKNPEINELNRKKGELNEALVCIYNEIHSMEKNITDVEQNIKVLLSGLGDHAESDKIFKENLEVATGIVSEYKSDYVEIAGKIRNLTLADKNDVAVENLISTQRIKWAEDVTTCKKHLKNLEEILTDLKNSKQKALDDHALSIEAEIKNSEKCRQDAQLLSEFNENITTFSTLLGELSDQLKGIHTAIKELMFIPEMQDEVNIAREKSKSDANICGIAFTEYRAVEAQQDTLPKAELIKMMRPHIEALQNLKPPLLERKQQLTALVDEKSTDLKVTIEADLNSSLSKVKAINSQMSGYTQVVKIKFPSEYNNLKEYFKELKPASARLKNELQATASIENLQKCHEDFKTKSTRYLEAARSVLNLCQGKLNVIKYALTSGSNELYAMFLQANELETLVSQQDDFQSRCKTNELAINLKIFIFNIVKDSKLKAEQLNEVKTLRNGLAHYKFKFDQDYLSGLAASAKEILQYLTGSKRSISFEKNNTFWSYINKSLTDQHLINIDNYLTLYNDRVFQFIDIFYKYNTTDETIDIANKQDCAFALAEIYELVRHAQKSGLDIVKRESDLKMISDLRNFILHCQKNEIKLDSQTVLNQIFHKFNQTPEPASPEKTIRLSR